MEREGGGGIGMGNTCKPMADSFRCMTKSTTIKKKISKKKKQKKKQKQSVDCFTDLQSLCFGFDSGRAVASFFAFGGIFVKNSLLLFNFCVFLLFQQMTLQLIQPNLSNIFVSLPDYELSDILDSLKGVLGHIILWPVDN